MTKDNILTVRDQKVFVKFAITMYFWCGDLLKKNVTLRLTDKETLSSRFETLGVINDY